MTDALESPMENPKGMMRLLSMGWLASLPSIHLFRLGPGHAPAAERKADFAHTIRPIEKSLD